MRAIFYVLWINKLPYLKTKNGNGIIWFSRDDVTNAFLSSKIIFYACAHNILRPILWSNKLPYFLK